MEEPRVFRQMNVDKSAFVQLTLNIYIWKIVTFVRVFFEAGCCAGLARRSWIHVKECYRLDTSLFDEVWRMSFLPIKLNTSELATGVYYLLLEGLSGQATQLAFVEIVVMK